MSEPIDPIASMLESVPRFYARMEIGYGGINLEPGQLFTLTGQPNDVKLVMARYIAAAPDGDSVPCPQCDAEFISAMHLRRHVHRNHDDVDRLDQARKIDAPPPPAEGHLDVEHGHLRIDDDDRKEPSNG